MVLMMAAASAAAAASCLAVGTGRRIIAVAAFEATASAAVGPRHPTFGPSSAAVRLEAASR